MKEKNKFILVLFLITLSIGQIYPESSLLDKASAAEKEGKLEIAVNIYNEWLKENSNSNNYYDTLIHMLSIEKDPEKALKVQKSYEDKIKSKNKSDFFERMAQLEEILGYIDEAEISYKKAWLSSEKDNFKYLLSSAILLFTMGKMDEAEQEALNVSSRANNKNTIVKSLILLANIYETTDRTAKAVEQLKTVRKNYRDSNLMPAVLASLYQLYKREKDTIKSKEIFKELHDSFPDSIYYHIINPGNDSGIQFFPNPALLLNITLDKDTKTYSVQAGSFHVKENAFYLVKDLKEAGFNASIQETSINNKQYFRVMIGPVVNFKEAQKVVNNLTKKGFSGFVVK